MRKIKEKNESGITLVALVVTIIVLLILAGITIATLFGDNGVIEKAQKAKDETQKAQENEIQGIEDIIKKLEGEKNMRNYEIAITDKIENFNEPLGPVTSVYTIIGKYNGETVFEDIVYQIFSDDTEKVIKVNAELPEGTVVTVSEVYSGASYELTTTKDVQKIAKENTAPLEFKFARRYNGGNRGNGVETKQNDMMIAYVENDYRIETCASGDGSQVIYQGAQIQQNQEKTTNGAKFTIENLSEINDCFVRVKIFCVNDLAYLVKPEETNNLWKLGKDNYWYYEQVIASGNTTEPIVIQKNKDYKIVVISECSPVEYDGDGNAFADWEHVSTQ